MLTATTVVPAVAQVRVTARDAGRGKARLQPTRHATDLNLSRRGCANSSPVRTHTVSPGDTFWSIAEDTIRAVGHAASDHDVVSYWHALIDLNRVLGSGCPGEPDLIFPGQVFELPPLS